MENMRKERGYQISLSKEIRKIKGGYLVPSQSCNKTYFVDEHDFNCTCPDCQTRNMTCKHAYAVRYYLKIDKDTPQGTVTEKMPLTYKQAWSAYNQAQNVEVNKFDELLKELVQNIEEPEYVFGRPAISLREQVFCSIQKVYSQLSSRRAKSLFNNAHEKGYLKRNPNYNVVNKLMVKPELTPILQELVGISASPLKAVENDFAIDSSGFRTTTFNDYCREKHHTRKHHKWIKCHICTGVKTNIITGARITEETGADTKQFSPLIKETTRNGFNIVEASADKAYSSRDNIALVDEMGATAYIPFKKNATGKAKGKNHAWKRMFHYFMMNQEEFAEHYHKRSNVETTFHMIKMKFGDCLKSKKPKAQENELLCKIIAHNIVVLIHEMYELGIKPDFCS